MLQEMSFSINHNRHIQKTKYKKKELNFLNISNYRFAKGQDMIDYYFFTFHKKKNEFVFIGDHKSSEIYFWYLNWYLIIFTL